MKNYNSSEQIDIESGYRNIFRGYGFSTIELAVVLAIVGLISGIAIPSYLSWRANSQLRAAAREINSLFQRTRMEALKQNTTLTIRFDAVGGEGSNLVSYQVFKDTGALAGNGVIEDDEADSVILNDTVENINFPGLDNIAIAFNSRGMLSKYFDKGVDQGAETPTINLRSDGSQYLLQVTLVRTGHSRIKTS
ncbi:MAG: GspH/FimT family pseudopilin [Desulfobulbaceae bacterium]|nr:GspH/FimT family pseudopilin [Desulfobulbaceae bacterium]